MSSLLHRVALSLGRVALALPLLIFGLGDYAAAGDRIAVVMSSREQPYEAALAGFQSYLRKSGIQAEYEIYDLGGRQNAAVIAVANLKKTRPRVIAVLGSLAAAAVLRDIKDIPVVAFLVLRADSIAGSANATGIVLEFPPDVHFTWQQRIIPGVRTVGVIYDPRQNQARVDAAIRFAEQLQLKVEARPVQAPHDVPAALDYLSKRADVIWGVPDSIALAPQIAKHMLLFSFRNSIPFIGPSSQWVKAGALYSLDGDYADIGRQAGGMAEKILNGTPPASLPQETPRTVRYSVNLSTARQMKIVLAADLVQGAQQVFRGDE